MSERASRAAKGIRLDEEPAEVNASWNKEAGEIIKVWLIPVNFPEEVTKVLEQIDAQSEKCLEEVMINVKAQSSMERVMTRAAVTRIEGLRPWEEGLKAREVRQGAFRRVVRTMQDAREKGELPSNVGAQRGGHAQKL